MLNFLHRIFWGSPTRRIVSIATGILVMPAWVFNYENWLTVNGYDKLLTAADSPVLLALSGVAAFLFSDIVRWSILSAFAALFVESAWRFRKERSAAQAAFEPQALVEEAAVQPTAPSHPSALPNLKELFDSDFIPGKGIHAMAPGSQKIIWEDGFEAELEVILVLEFTAHAKFTAIYVPPSDETVKICEGIADNISAFTNIQTSMIVGGGGTEDIKASELMFTGRVFVYHETSMSLTEKGHLAIYYQEKGLWPQFRSASYALHVQMSQASQKAIDSAPLSPSNTGP